MSANINQLSPGDLRLIGVSTDRRVGPLEPFFINLDPGTAVIYGRNGSGKTFALRVIAQPHEYTLYLKSRPSTTYPSTPSSYFWHQLDLETQSGYMKFHDNMHHFLDERQRHKFCLDVRQICVNALHEAVSTGDSDVHVDSNLWIHEYRDAFLAWRKRKHRSPHKLIPHDWERLFSAIELIAYKNELWILGEEVTQIVVTQLLNEIVLGQTFVVQRDRLFLAESSPGGFFSRFIGDLTDSYSDRDESWIHLVETYGGLGDSWDNWEERKLEPMAPWESVHIKTGVSKPRWGRSIADVDLDHQHYGEVTSTNFLEEIRSLLEAERRYLPDDDPRHLPFQIDGNRALLLESDDATAWDKGAIDLIREIVNRANDIFGQLLEAAPILECVRTPVGAWAESPPISWEARTKSGTMIPLTALSWAEQRWASMAIRLATPSSDLPLKLLVIDEPERGLHRRAERTLANALQHLSQSQDITCVVATHSPAFLGLKGARLHHIWKNSDGTSTLDSLPSDFEPWVHELGLEKADLLQLCRLFLIVEGEHDAIILNTLFKDEFSQHGVRVLPLRGLRNITNATDASFIFRYTEASILYLTDNDNHRRVADIWTRAVLADPEDRLDVISEFATTRDTAEAQFLKEFASLAINFSAKSRINFTALPAEDVLDYLPVKHFIPSATSWAALRDQWGRPKKGNFKTWLTNHHNANFNPELILRSVESLDDIPTDLVNLLDIIISATTIRSSTTD